MTPRHRHLFKHGLALLLSTSLAASTLACPGLISALPAVTSAIVEVGNIVDVIATWVALYFKQHPDPAGGGTEAEIGEAIARTRNAMNVVLRLAEPASGGSSAEVTAAFDVLEAAYRELLELTRPLGVRPEGLANGRVGASPAGLSRETREGGILTVPATLRRPQ